MIGFYLILLGKLLNFNLCKFGYPEYQLAICVDITRIRIRKKKIYGSEYRRCIWIRIQILPFVHTTFSFFTGMVAYCLQFSSNILLRWFLLFSKAIKFLQGNNHLPDDGHFWPLFFFFICLFLSLIWWNLGVTSISSILGVC